MAIYNPGAAGNASDINDFEKVQSYLFKMNEQLQYMFSNLSPEDNYSKNEGSKLTYVSDGSKQASMESSLSGIVLNYVGDTQSESVLNLSDGSAILQGDTIYLKGKLDINDGKVIIDTDGALSGTHANFSGDFIANAFTGNEVNANVVNATTMSAENFSTTNNSFFVTESGENGSVVGFSGFYIEDKIIRSETFGSVTNPASGDDCYIAINGTTGYAGFRDIYILEGRYAGRSLSSALQELYDRSSGGGGGDDGDDGYDNGDDMPGNGTVDP